MNETKKPAVRFKGFSVEWERHPMDELTTELHEYATLEYQKKQLSNLQKTRQSLQESSNIVKMVRRSGWAPRNLKLRFLN